MTPEEQKEYKKDLVEKLVQVGYTWLAIAGLASLWWWYKYLTT